MFWRRFVQGRCFRNYKLLGIRALSHCRSGLIPPTLRQRRVANQIQLQSDVTARMDVKMKNSYHVIR
jgi:hypothetical protein